VSRVPANYRRTSYAIRSRASFGSVLRAEVRRTASTHQVQWACLQLLQLGCMELTACRHPVQDEQTNFQNIPEISFLSSSCWYFIVTANCLLLGAHVLIVMGALQIYIDDDDDDDDDALLHCIAVVIASRLRTLKAWSMLRLLWVTLTCHHLRSSTAALSLRYCHTWLVATLCSVIIDFASSSASSLAYL